MLGVSVLCVCVILLYICILLLSGYLFSFVFLQPGVEVSVEEIEQAVNEVFEENKNVILEQRYRTNG